MWTPPIGLHPHQSHHSNTHSTSFSVSRYSNLIRVCQYYHCRPSWSIRIKWAGRQFAFQSTWLISVIVKFNLVMIFIMSAAHQAQPTLWYSTSLACMTNVNRLSASLDETRLSLCSAASTKRIKTTIERLVFNGTSAQDDDVKQRSMAVMASTVLDKRCCMWKYRSTIRR